MKTAVVLAVGFGFLLGRWQMNETWARSLDDAGIPYPGSKWQWWRNSPRQEHR